LKSLLKERIFWPLLTVALAGVLIALGTLQYRWSKEVSDATTSRLRASLNSSLLAFRQDFEGELAGVTAAFQRDGATSNPQDLAEQFRSWKSTASHTGIVKSLYLAEQRSGQQPRLLCLNASDSGFETAVWPTELNAIEETLPRFSIRKPGMPPPRREGPQFSGSIGWAGRDGHFFVTTGESRTVGVGVVGEEPEHAKRKFDSQKSDRVGSVHRFPKIPWFIDAAIPALISPVDPFWNGEPEQETSRWIIIELDQDFLSRHLFPELAARYFSGSDGVGYDTAVLDIKDGAQNRLVFGSSIPANQADGKLDLFGFPGPPRAMDTVAIQLRPEEQKTILSGNREWNIGFATRNPEYNPVPPLILVSAAPVDGDWQLVVKNRLGSVEAAAASLRRRELGLSFGVLLVLAGTMAMLIAASRRAHRLARLQMDFVAGVSHELRTPLAVISSAAENIADGLVENREQITRYGNVIKNQSAQLKQLVEQILMFAANRHGKRHYTLRLAEPCVVIDLALENTAELVRAAGIKVEKNVQSNLPAISIDINALAHCLQNLITNAVKYGGDARWIGVSAAERQTAVGPEVAITISDRGIGIDDNEIQQLFDPFFRGAAVREAQIHGSGLGLPLAKGIVEAMGGHITVESAPGSGSAFTVHLPIPKLDASVCETPAHQVVTRSV